MHVASVDLEQNLLTVERENGQQLTYNPHVDYGYAVTSHSSQGATADRVLVHVDTG